MIDNIVTVFLCPSTILNPTTSSPSLITLFLPSPRHGAPHVPWIPRPPSPPPFSRKDWAGWCWWTPLSFQRPCCPQYKCNAYIPFLSLLPLLSHLHNLSSTSHVLLPSLISPSLLLLSNTRPTLLLILLFHIFPFPSISFPQIPLPPYAFSLPPSHASLLHFYQYHSPFITSPLSNTSSSSLSYEHIPSQLFFTPLSCSCVIASATLIFPLHQTTPQGPHTQFPIKVSIQVKITWCWRGNV